MSQISRLRDAEIANGNIINADDLDLELNQLVSESNAQDTRLNSLENQPMTLGGSKTFSSPIKTAAIQEKATGEGVTIASVLHKNGSLQLAETAGFTPSQNGALGYNSTIKRYQVMEDGIIRSLNTAPLQPVTQSTNYTAVAADKGKLFLCSNTTTLSLGTASSLGNGWHITVKNSGTDRVTLTPAGSELINGQTGLVLLPGGNVQLVCDGVGFTTTAEFAPGLHLIKTQTVSNATSLDLTNIFSSHFEEYRLVVVGLRAELNDVNCYCRVSRGGVFQSGATDYQYGNRSSSGASNSQVGSNGSNQAVLTYNVAGGGISNGASDHFNLQMTLFNPLQNGFRKHMLFSALYTRSSGFHGLSEGSVVYQGSLLPLDGIQLFMSSGNIVTATARLYGVRKE
jgi:hypothetical protein